MLLTHQGDEILAQINVLRTILGQNSLFLVKFKGKVPNFDASWHAPFFQFTVLPMTQMKGEGPENMPFTFQPIICGS